MEKKKYTIKITGSGTLDEISDSLTNVLAGIVAAMCNESNDCQWEDPILMAEITEE